MDTLMIILISTVTCAAWGAFSALDTVSRSKVRRPGWIRFVGEYIFYMGLIGMLGMALMALGHNLLQQGRAGEGISMLVMSFLVLSPFVLDLTASRQKRVY